jgi:hypothetical protein
MSTVAQADLTKKELSIMQFVLAVPVAPIMDIPISLQ